MTEEPLGSHVLELQLTEVVEETADARSLVFGVPDGPDALPRDCGSDPASIRCVPSPYVPCQLASSEADLFPRARE